MNSFRYFRYFHYTLYLLEKIGQDFFVTLYLWKKSISFMPLVYKNKKSDRKIKNLVIKVFTFEYQSIIIDLNFKVILSEVRKRQFKNNIYEKIKFFLQSNLVIETKSIDIGYKKC